MDPMMPTLVGAIVAILLVGILLRRFHQPHAIAYLAAGVALGPEGLALFTDTAEVVRLGDIGVVLLLFFVGMEISLPRLVANWRVSVIGTAVQIALNTGVIAAFGLWLDWPLGRIVLLGFVTSLSSTAVVVTLLREWKELDTRPGQDALGILIVQDMALIPMMIVLGLLGGESPSALQVTGQVVGGLGILALLAFLLRRGSLALPFAAVVRKDHELQVFGAFLACFGMALVTGFLGLSAALGAFVAGIVLAATRETEWVHEALEPFRVILVALFFVSVGMLIDLSFLAAHPGLLLGLVLLTFATNTLINGAVLRSLGRTRRESLYVGALLAQIGEFSFVLAAIGRSSGLISDFGHQTVIGVIALTLLLGPAWVTVVHRNMTRVARVVAPIEDVLRRATQGRDAAGARAPADPAPADPADR